MSRIWREYAVSYGTHNSHITRQISSTRSIVVSFCITLLSKDMIGKSWWLGVSVSLAGIAWSPTIAQAGNCAQFSAPILYQKSAPYRDAIHMAARKYAVSPALITSVIASESCFRDSAVSHKGAIGLMQLMPTTAEDMGTSNAYDPVENIDAGTRYLAYLLQRYNGSLTHTIAAYNAGMGRVEAGQPVDVPFRETRGYVQNVLTALSTLERNPQANLYARRSLANFQRAEQLRQQGAQQPVYWQIPTQTGAVRAQFIATRNNAVQAQTFPAASRSTDEPSCDTVSDNVLQQTQRQGSGRYSAFFYVVKDGETMQDVATRFGKDKLSVLRLNPVSHDYEPMAGHRLKVAECFK